MASSPCVSGRLCLLVALTFDLARVRWLIEALQLVLRCHPKPHSLIQSDDSHNAVMLRGADVCDMAPSHIQQMIERLLSGEYHHHL